MCEPVFDVDGETVLHFCNTTYYIDRQGIIKLTYRKVNLWGDERKAFKKGNEHEVIETEEFGKLGLLICWDLAFPEAFRQLIKKGARIIVMPTLWKLPDCGPKGLAANPDSERIFINSVMSTRAFENNVCIVFCNTGGPAKSGHFGNSQITLPFKGPIVKLGCEEEVVTQEIEFGTILEDAEDVWNIRADVTSEGWYSAAVSST
jgi:predicted amidohydrolase